MFISLWIPSDNVSWNSFHLVLAETGGAFWPWNILTLLPQLIGKSTPFNSLNSRRKRSVPFPGTLHFYCFHTFFWTWIALSWIAQSTQSVPVICSRNTQNVIEFYTGGIKPGLIPSQYELVFFQKRKSTRGGQIPFNGHSNWEVWNHVLRFTPVPEKVRKAETSGTPAHSQPFLLVVNWCCDCTGYQQRKETNLFGREGY